MVFMSLSMNKVWSTYNMLQIIGNYLNFKMLHFTAASKNIVFICKNISFFNLLKNDHIQIWLKENIIGNIKFLKEILFNQGMALVGVIVIIFVMVVIVILRRTYA